MKGWLNQNKTVLILYNIITIAKYHNNLRLQSLNNIIFRDLEIKRYTIL